MGKTRKTNKKHKGSDFPKIKRPQKPKKDRQLHPYKRYGPEFFEENVNEGDFSQFLDEEDEH
jgi:hypothetical protein